MLNVYVVVLLAVTIIANVAEFNNSVCPGPLELQSEAVQANFNMDLFTGVYYEVAYHDYTQNPMCPNRKCTRSVKVFNESLNVVNDNFTMYCGTKTQEKEYIVPFVFNVTSQKGFFWGEEEKFHTKYPDTVVAIGDSVYNDDTKKTQYEWVVEFQCKEEHLFGGSHVYFVGINFYCYQANPPQSMLDEMVNAAYKQGLGLWLDQALYYTNQTDCVY
eukprot:CAMPEP_0202692522 /NCGR_PEP_ID=MMETSP1385-20130828/6878_1 /ASSEMBLY_ACC=CAM_ASM_000861 /TAXON_ID=933848 /ORGANISM="Elphidium margaritaceum" /LENGTH=215 /DNA_ID=CAMNT_0049348065 /DNA_START=76 /DNA_END=723 /DNA_ORIENTATION=+